MAGPRTSVERACEQCGKVRRVYAYQLAKGQGRFCSSRCFGASLEVEQRLCSVCKKQPVKGAKNRICSPTCAGVARRRRVTRPCALCGVPVTRPPSLSPGARVFCSHAHYAASLRGTGRVAQACRSCGTVRQVSAVRLARGLGRFCSRRCFAQSRVKPREQQPCRQCQAPIAVLPSQTRRRYCSRRCVWEAHAPRSHNCHACGRVFWRPTWREARYCSLTCSQGRQHRRRDPVVTVRDQRILELHAEGLRAPAIVAALEADPRCVPGPTGADWRIGEAAVRQVVSRARRAGHERSVTLRA